VNVALKLALMGPLAQVGLAVATSISAWVNAGLLAWLLTRRGLFRADARLTRNIPRMALATLAMGGTLWLVQERLSPWLTSNALLERLGGLVLLGVAGQQVRDMLRTRRVRSLAGDPQASTSLVVPPSPRPASDAPDSPAAPDSATAPDSAAAPDSTAG